jgi:hypothetical protein
MKQQSTRKSSSDEQGYVENLVFFGTTTLQRMISAAFDTSNPLCKRNTYAECFAAKWDLEEDLNRTDEVVDIYYHKRQNETIMTNVEGDVTGVMGSSAGFEGEVMPKDVADAFAKTDGVPKGQ